MTKPTIPSYQTPEGFRCPDCNAECLIIALQNEFDYSGTHATHGKSGTEYPSDWGSPVTDCCEADCESALLNNDETYDSWSAESYWRLA